MVDETRPWIGEADFREQETFVVAEGDVVARAVVLDQLALQQQRFLLVAHRVELEIVDRVDQRAGLHARPHFLRGHEIGRHALLQIPRLADVDDGAETVLHQVNPGLVGHLAELGSEIRGLHSEVKIETANGREWMLVFKDLTNQSCFTLWLNKKIPTAL